MEKVEYRYQGRNGYGAVDLYVNEKCKRTVYAGITQKLAKKIAADLQDAHDDGWVAGAAFITEQVSK